MTRCCSRSPAPAGIAAVAALSLALAAFGAPCHYGLAVVGITGSALLSVALSTPAGSDPWARPVDTVLGCAIVLVVGVLAWPRRGSPDRSRDLARATAALADYAERAPAAPEITDEAYRRARDWRAQLDRDVAEPDPAHTAADRLPVAHHFEQLIDFVAARRIRPAGPTPGRCYAPVCGRRPRRPPFSRRSALG